MTPKQAHDLLYDENGKGKVHTNEWLTVLSNNKNIVQISINQRNYVHVRIATKVNLVDYETKEKLFSHYEWREFRESKGTWKECSSYGWYSNFEEMKQEAA